LHHRSRFFVREPSKTTRFQLGSFCYHRVSILHCIVIVRTDSTFNGRILEHLIALQNEECIEIQWGTMVRWCYMWWRILLVWRWNGEWCRHHKWEACRGTQRSIMLWPIPEWFQSLDGQICLWLDLSVFQSASLGCKGLWPWCLSDIGK
jgi:hypothetical protein